MPDTPSSADWLVLLFQAFDVSLDVGAVVYPIAAGLYLVRAVMFNL